MRYLFVFLIILMLIPTVLAQSCNTAADVNCDGVVSLDELMDYIDEWYMCSACVPDLYQAIEAYICIPDCAGKECGDDGCVGSCGTCPDGYYCDGGGCVEAVTNCTKYVDDTGSGTACSSASPCSLDYAKSNAIEGHVVCLMSGNYGDVTFDGTSATGTSNNWITYKAADGETPLFNLFRISEAGDKYLIFDGITVQVTEMEQEAVTVEDSNHLILRNMEIIGQGYLQPYWRITGVGYNSVGIYLTDSENIEISDCNIYGVGDSFAENWPGSYSETGLFDPSDFGKGFTYGIYTENVPNLNISGCVIESCDVNIRLREPLNSTITGNTLRYVGSDGIEIVSCINPDGQETVLENNHIYNMAYFTNAGGESLGSHADGIQFFGQDGSGWLTYRNMVVRGNIVHDKEGIQGFFFRVGDDSENWIIENNLLYKVPINYAGTMGGAVRIFSADNVTFRNNTVVGGVSFETEENDGVPTDCSVTSVENNIIHRFVPHTASVAVENEDYNIIRYLFYADGHTLGDHSIVLENYGEFDALFVNSSDDDYTPASDNIVCDGTRPDTTEGVAWAGALPCEGEVQPECALASDCPDQSCSTKDCIAEECVYIPVPDGVHATCPDDGQYCDGTETCQSGSCVHTGSPCPHDSYSCTLEACSEPTQSCSTDYDYSACDDSNECTNDTCIGSGGQASTGCNYSFNINPCNDGIACTENDACSSGDCQPGIPNNNICLDEFPDCTDATCDTGLGCINYQPEGCSVPQLPTDYISYWKFDGDASDETGTNNGTVIGDPQFVSGHQGQAIELDGEGDWIDIAHNPSLNFGTGDFTFIAWIYLDTLSLDQTILAKRTYADDFEWGFTNSNKQRLYIDSDYDSGSFEFSANTWYLLGVVRNSGTIQFFVNGSSDGSPFSLPSSISNTHPLYIGTRVSGQRGLNAKVDNVMIFNRSLSSQEIQQIYNAQK